MTKRILISALCLILLSTPAVAITQIVTSTGDSGTGSLRNAITYANSLGGSQLINFAINAADKTICPLTPLPAITTSTTIDGWSQSGYPGYTGYPLITLTGTCAGTGSGLEITAGSATLIRGLIIRNWAGYGVSIYGPANQTIVSGNFIGTNDAGTAAAGNILGGVLISGSNTNRIGGTTDGGINLISGNGDVFPNGNGIFIANGSSGNSIIHNLIGTDITGTYAIANQSNGIVINQSPYTTVGGAAAVYRNVISGNVLYGISISGPNSSNNLVAGNYVGTDITGLLAIPNSRSGILIYNAGSNAIGGSSWLYRNVISGNTRNGVTIDGSYKCDEPTYCPDPPLPYAGLGYATMNVVIGNYIGVDKNGTLAVPNGFRGVQIYDAQVNGIGGDQPGQGNVISGNLSYGIYVHGDVPDPGDPVGLILTAEQNWIFGNKIGVDINNDPRGNGGHGIFITPGKSNYVGAPTPASSGNTIKNNIGFGLRVRGTDCNTNYNSLHNIYSGNTQGNFMICP